jgi:hypothetical protein
VTTPTWRATAADAAVNDGYSARCSRTSRTARSPLLFRSIVASANSRGIHGCNAALKNLLDHYFAEWNRKPISFLGYGNAVGSQRNPCAKARLGSRQERVLNGSPLRTNGMGSEVSVSPDARLLRGGLSCHIRGECRPGDRR